MNLPQDVDRPDDALQLRALAWLFGDDEQDPGMIAEEASRRDDMLPWLEQLGADYGALKRAAAPGSEDVALARLEALARDIRERRSGAVDWDAARSETNVRSLGAARARRSRPRASFNLLVGAFTAFAVAAVIFMLTRPSAPMFDVDARTAQVLLQDLGDGGAMGFAGAAAPSARDRGFMLGAIIDLSRRRSDGEVPAPSETSLAKDLVERLLTGLDAPDDASERIRRALGGCSAILVDTADRAACERGLADYIARRDAFFSAR